MQKEQIHAKLEKRFTVHRSPFTVHRSPFTVHRSPFTVHRSNLKKKLSLLIHSAILAAVLMSCTSMQDRMMTPQEQAEATVLGPVSDTITVLRLFTTINTDDIKSRAYNDLKEKAVEQYGYSNVEIRNITMRGGMSGGQILFFAVPIGMLVGGLTMSSDSSDIGKPLAIAGGALIIPLNLIFQLEKVTVTGEAVLFGPGVRPLPSNWSLKRMTNQQRIELIMDNIVYKLINDMPTDATIAILSMYSAERQTAEYVINELEYKLFASKKFIIVDRRRLEQIRREQNFQMSGEVDDASAVSIGNMLGATIVLTGDITTDAAGGLLVVRALDVQTGRIIMMARERF